MNKPVKITVRVVLIAVIAFLAYMTYNSIAEPVRYQKEVKREEAVIIERLEILRDAQLAYRDVNGSFTGDFDTLIDFMQHGELKVTIAYGDLDDSTTVYREETRMISVKDSLFKGVDIPNVRYVPFLDKVEFIMEAGETEKNGVVLPTFMIKDPKPYSKERIREKNALQVGSLSDADYSGNWK